MSFDKFCNKDIQISGMKKASFLGSIQININIKLMKKMESYIRLKAIIDSEIKDIIIQFASKDKCNNSGYKILKDDIKKDDNSGFFSYTFNELSAHGME